MSKFSLYYPAQKIESQQVSVLLALPSFPGMHSSLIIPAHQIFVFSQRLGWKRKHLESSVLPFTVYQNYPGHFFFFLLSIISKYLSHLWYDLSIYDKISMSFETFFSPHIFKLSRISSFYVTYRYFLISIAWFLKHIREHMYMYNWFTLL